MRVPLGHPGLRKPFLKGLWNDIDDRIQVDGIEVITAFCCRYQMLYTLFSSFITQRLSHGQDVLERLLGIICALEISACSIAIVSRGKD